jgi:hypothetical protein
MVRLFVLVEEEKILTSVNYSKLKHRSLPFKFLNREKFNKIKAEDYRLID